MRRTGVAAALSPGFQVGLLGVALLASVVTELSRPRGLALLGLLALAAVLTTPLATRAFLRRLVPLFSFGVVALVLLLLAPRSPGMETVVLPLWHRPVPASGLHFVVSLWVKSVLVLAWVTVFAQRLTERDLLEGLTSLRLPPRLVALCYLMVRNVQGVGAEVRRLVRACEARGRPRGWRALTVAVSMAAVLLTRLGRRADTQALAMVARGFAGGLPLLIWRPVRAGHLLALAGVGGVLVCLTRL
ncbi:MAG: hypothetical protein HPY69_12050 [Armatimonadetes bacterium]|nr:hypothetical protein [Armatimonadota bacterium]